MENLPDIAQPTNPGAAATLFVRVETPRGPRTTVQSNLTVAAAADLAFTMNVAGHYAVYQEERPGFKFSAFLARRKKMKERKRKALAKAKDMGVIPFKRLARPR